MNVFVLCTGRCGSVTWAEACKHISNFTAGHESRWGRFGADRLDYPDRHIEVDNRLVWYLGLIDRLYGGDAFYVHLVRNRQAVIASYVERHHRELMAGWRCITDMELAGTPEQRASDYVDAANAAIESFIRDKPYWLRVNIETAVDSFCEFCSAIGAVVDDAKALPVLLRRHNQGLEGVDEGEAGPPMGPK